jgi:hypothetical protein
MSPQDVAFFAAKLSPDEDLFCLGRGGSARSTWDGKFTVSAARKLFFPVFQNQPNQQEKTKQHLILRVFGRIFSCLILLVTNLAFVHRVAFPSSCAMSEPRISGEPRANKRR